MRFRHIKIPTHSVYPKSRLARVGRLLSIFLLAAVIASPSVSRFLQHRDLARLAGEYQSLVENGCYEEAKQVANLAAEKYPTSSVAKYMAAQSGALISLIFGQLIDDNDPFSASVFDVSDQQS
jgi:hypothetical protein